MAAIIYVTLLGDNGEAYNIADNSSNISIREFAETIASTVNLGVTFETPADVEAAGFNTVSQSVFDTRKLESLGWKPIGEFNDNVRVIINELMNI